MVDYTKFAKFYVAVSTLVALACTVGFVVMVATMPQCPHLTNFKCPTTEGHTSQPPSSIGPYGITPPLLDSTDIVLEDFVTSLTMPEVYEAKTKTKQGSITRREPHGKNFPFPDPDSINDDGEFPSPVTSDAGNPDVKPQPETSSTTSPEADGFIEQLIRSLLSMMNDPDLQNLEDQHLLNIMLINIVNATYSRHTHRMEAETEAIRQNTSNNVQKIRKSSGTQNDGGEEMESENKSTVNIAKMVNGLANFNINVESQLNGDDDIPSPKNNEGWISNTKTQAIDEAHVRTRQQGRHLQFGRGKAFYGGTESVEVDDSLQRNRTSTERCPEQVTQTSDVLMIYLTKCKSLNVGSQKDSQSMGWDILSIDSSSDDDISEIDIQKQRTGIGFLNTKTQAIDESHVFELDITKVMEEIAASDVLDELDNVNANFNINVESQLNGLGHSNSIDSSSDDDISEIDIQKTTKGIGFANTKTQAIDEAHVFELDITKVMEEIAASDVLDELDNLNANFNINVESQLNGLGHSNSIDSSSDDDISK
ncbi:hypothetical protein OUZ56_005165 [Daphnia magna]|uniref:Uncharacterized protein n=1 Tax=Daphnia magna TaxID=35525 RepID=A0ABQ9YS07_9CRUS|nr:hypothetical protein OUZ56_005165 [Daphnia magna]